MNVYVIEWFWDSNDRCPDNWANLQENGVEAVCISKEGVVRWCNEKKQDIIEEQRKDYEDYILPEDHLTFEQWLIDQGYTFKIDQEIKAEDIFCEEGWKFNEDWTSSYFRVREMPIEEWAEKDYEMHQAQKDYISNMKELSEQWAV